MENLVGLLGIVSLIVTIVARIVYIRSCYHSKDQHNKK